MNIRKRLQALERQVEQPSYRLVITMLDENGQKWKLTDDGTWAPVEPGELDGVRVVKLDFGGDE
jgi:hypothetical protein